MGSALIFLSVGLQASAVVLAFVVVWPVRSRWVWLLIPVAMGIQTLRSLMEGQRLYQAGGSLPVPEWISPLILLLCLVGLKALVLERSRILPQASPPPSADLTRLMESVVDTADVWINTLDLRSQVVLWNRAAERISGYQRDEVLGGTKIWEWLYPDEAYRTGITQQAAAILQRDEAVRNFETTIRTKTGETRVISWNSKSLQDEQGRIAGSLAIGQDVTERKDTERALRESERKLSQLIGNLPGFVYRSVKVGNWTLGYLSEGFRKITGCEPEEFIGDPNRSYLELVPLSHREAIRAKWQLILEDQSVFEEEYPITTASGEIRWVWERGHGTYDEEGRLLFVEGFVTDITERKQTEEALRASEALFRSYIESSPIGVFICDEKGRYLQVNRAAEVITGYSREELLTLSIPALLPPASAEQGSEHFRHLVETGHSTGELGFRHKDGHTGYWSVEAVRLQPAQFLGFASDITERKRIAEETARLQTQLHQAQKMESLGSLAGGVAHDMNNVLGAILGLASANLELQPAGSPARLAFEVIITAAERGGKVLKALLNFARQSPAVEQELDMNAVLQEEVRLLERTALSKVHLAMDLASDLRPVRGDASALTNAFMNLSLNAVDAMTEEGTLTLRTRNIDTDWIEVQVEDTGCGMPEEILEKALDPFFTTKPEGKGTGLGLSTVYSTVKAHRGQMEILSKPGQGTLVKMRFPTCEPVAQIPERIVEPSSVSPSKGLDVLLVDDDELIRSSLQALLKVLGHRVTSVSSGEEALATLAADFQPDVVILDMNMPGLGGSGTLPRLRVLRPTVPVLLATGRADQTALDLVEAYPKVTLLPKPFGLKELKQLLEPLGCG